MTPRKWKILFIAFAAISSAYGEPPLPVVAEFTLTDDRGDPWSWGQVRGKVGLVAFGYTSCPDLCPLTLNVIAQSLRRLGPAADGVQPLFISVDGERDRPETLHRYVKHFDARIVGLTGSSEEVRTAARRFNVSHTVTATSVGRDYTVDHTANMFVVGSNGRIAAIVPFGFPVEHVVSLVEAELKSGSGGGW